MVQQQVIQVRLIADTREGLAEAISEMQAKFPAQVSGFAMPSRIGHKGGWLTYGSLVLGAAEPQVIRVDPSTSEISD